jgi:hypothetical protein
MQYTVHAMDLLKLGTLITDLKDIALQQPSSLTELVALAYHNAQIALGLKVKPYTTAMDRWIA